MSITVISCNVRGLRDVLKRRAIFNFYRPKAKIICLQETHSVIEDEVIWKSEWGGDIVFSHGLSNARGVCVLLPKGFLSIITDIEHDECGRCVSFQWEQNGVNLIICAVYAPNEDKPNFYLQTISNMVNKGDKIVIISDFNLTLNDNYDRISVANTKPNSKQMLKNLMDEYALVDIWRMRNPESKRFSWYKCRPKLSASRIDFALLSLGITDCCDSVFYTTGLHSDHLAMFLSINISQSERGPGYWKMNISLLKKQSFLDEMNKVIDDTLNQNANLSACELWEYLKYRIRDVARSFAKSQASEIALIISQLSEHIMEMEEDLELANRDLLQKTKDDLNEFSLEQAKGCIFRSKARYVELGEHSTRYFFNLEKSRHNAKTCNALFNEQNVLVKDSKAILKLQEDFYAKLYTSDPGIVCDWKKRNWHCCI